MRALLEGAYEAFDRRDIDAVVGMTPDTDWPNAWEGGYVHGHEAVRDDWTGQWQELDTAVHPVAITLDGDGRVRVLVEQTVRRVGEPADRTTGRVTHTDTLGTGLVARMDVEPV